MSDLATLSALIEKGKRNDARQLTQTLLDQGLTPLDIVEKGLVPGMSSIGEKFKNNEVFVPEMLIAARAMKECMGLLEPLLAKAGIKPKYTAVLGTVQGDLHDIGKNLVAMKTTVDAIRAAGLTNVKIMVGGAPVTAEYAKEIGADGFGPDAASAVDILLKMVEA